jgi:hypothetical protein
MTHAEWIEVEKIVQACDRAEKLIESGNVTEAINLMSPYFGVWKSSRLAHKYAQIHGIETATGDHWRIVRGSAWRWYHQTRPIRLAMFKSHKA